MENLAVVAVDTGNKNIKTPNSQPFNAGLISHGHQVPPIDVETLKFDGRYYSLTERRIPYSFDKTESPDYYILTLFAIAKELMAQEPGKLSYKKDIFLAVGLPPAHLQSLKQKYIHYFGREGKPVSFTFKNTDFKITVVRVGVYPQGFAAVAPNLGDVRNRARTFIVDIGGYTTDVVMLKRGGEPDLNFCESFNMGVIRMCDRISRAVRNRYRVDLDDYMIDEILRGKNDGSGIYEIAMSEASKYTQDLIRSLKEKGVDLSVSYPVFLGGGAVLMHDVIVKELDCREYRFIEDVRANAIGYDFLARVAIVNEGLK